MGAGASTQKHRPYVLKARDIYSFTRKYKLSVAELYFVYLQYLDIQRAVESMESQNNSTRTMKLMDRIVNDQRTPFQMLLEYDWLFHRIFFKFFPIEDLRELQFNDFLEGLISWRNKSYSDRLSFAFEILDIDEDGIVGISDITRVLENVLHRQLKVGDQVFNRKNFKFGKLRFLGTVDFADGVWGGIEFTEPIGKNNGSVNGVSYFKCRDQYGLFLPVEHIGLKEHYTDAVEMINVFTDGSNSDSFDLESFQASIQNESWMMELIQSDPIPSCLKG